MQQSITIKFHIGTRHVCFPHTALRTELQDADGFATTFAASRLLLSDLGQLDIREFSLNRGRFDSLINWELQSSHWFDQDRLLRNPHFFMWNHYFATAPLWEIGRHSFYIVELTEQDLALLPDFYLAELDRENPLDRVILSGEHLKVKSKYLFLNLKDYDLGRFSPPKVYIDTIGLFNGLYRRKQEQWLVYSIPQGEYPDEETLADTQAIIIPGSTSSTYDDKEWIRSLERFLVRIYEQHQHIKLLGICFGFQILSQAFNGQIEPTRLRKKQRSHNYIGNSIVNLSEELLRWDCFRDLGLKKQILVNRAHGDQVTVLPKLFSAGACSKIAQNEILFSQDGRVFGMQCHPEYSSELLHLYGCEMRASAEKLPFEAALSDADFKNFFQETADEQGQLMCLAFLKY